MDDVVVDPLGPAMRLDALDELGQVSVLHLARHGRLGARGQMDDARALPQWGDAGDRGVLRTREDVHGDAHAPELARRLANVDVHAARFLASERSQGAGVDAEHGDAEAHDVTRTRKISCGVGPKAYL